MAVDLKTVFMGFDSLGDVAFWLGFNGYPGSPHQTITQTSENKGKLPNMRSLPHVLGWVKSRIWTIFCVLEVQNPDLPFT